MDEDVKFYNEERIVYGILSQQPKTYNLYRTVGTYEVARINHYMNN